MKIVVDEEEVDLEDKEEEVNVVFVVEHGAQLAKQTILT